MSHDSDYPGASAQRVDRGPYRFDTTPDAFNFIKPLRLGKRDELDLRSGLTSLMSDATHQYLTGLMDPDPKTETPKDTIETLGSGAKQSKLDVRYDLVPRHGLHRVAETMARGAEKYGDNNWRKGGITVESNLNHALNHIYTYLTEQREGATPVEGRDHAEDELAHAAARLLMAIDAEEGAAG